MTTDTYIYFVLFGIFILLLCSAFFSSSETALMASSKARLHSLEKEGHKAAARVNRLLKSPDTLLGTILLGNNLVNIGASALATGVFIKLFGEGGIAFATLTMTILVLVFAEVLPKTLAARRAERYAMHISWVMMKLVKLLRPFTWAIEVVNSLVLKLAGMATHHAEYRAEDVRGAIGLGLKHGILEKDEHQMLDSILDLNELTVADVMIHRSAMESFNINTPLEQLYRAVAKTTHSRLPMWEGEPDNIIGILHVKDFFRSYIAHQDAATPMDIAQVVRKPYFVPENVSIANQMLAFREQRRHIAIVVDEYGDIQGLVTLEDILEEIVGDIEDEHDIASTSFTTLPNGDVLMDGATAVRDINKEFDWHLPETDAVTIAGLMIDIAAHIPAVGEKVDIAGRTFKVVAKKRQAVLRVQATSPTPENTKNNDY